jgi:hypothetical protein
VALFGVVACSLVSGLTVFGVRTRSEPSPKGEAEIASGAPRRMGRSTRQEHVVERQAQVPEVHGQAEGGVGAGLVPWWPIGRGVCREHNISETLLRRWRDQMIDAGAARYEEGQDRSVAAEQRRRIAELERALAAQDL